ncbi:MAG: DNA repair protein RecO [Candidatus Marinimicrobia bacterium]|nr:DNA repair protein RecO [Candidatus Neomarinimicrobiota bacterium]
MSLIKTEALILRTIPFQESSSIARMFTREQGKIAVIAKGARRMKSALRGFLEPLNYIEAIYYYKSTRDIQTLSKIDLIQAFFSDNPVIESNIFGLALLETVDKVVHDHQHDHEIFDCAVQHLKLMDAKPETCRVTFIRFLLALTNILGYLFEINNCPRCRASLSGAVYNPGTGQLICLDCGQQFSAGHRLSESDIAFLKGSESDSQFQPVNHAKLLRMLIHYLSYHLDVSLNLKSLQLLTDIKI